MIAEYKKMAAFAISDELYERIRIWQKQLNKNASKKDYVSLSEIYRVALGQHLDDNKVPLR